MIRASVAFAAALSSPVAGPSPRLEVQGTEFALVRGDRIERGEDLAGALLTVEGLDGRLLIEGVKPDRESIGGPVTLYRLAVIDRSGRRSEFCEADSAGLRRGFPIADGSGGFTLACTSGANGKCVRWGYRPWEDTPQRPMRALHAACMRMARADYGGDGQPHTRAGVTIIFWDRYGVRKRPNADHLPFEAGWDANGAVCVVRPRVPSLVSISSLRRAYSRLAAQRRCDERAAFAAGALIVNRIVPDALSSQPNRK